MSSKKSTLKHRSHRPTAHKPTAHCRRLYNGAAILSDVFEVAKVAREIESIKLDRRDVMSFNEFLNRALIEYIRKVIGQRIANKLYQKYFREIENKEVNVNQCLINELHRLLTKLDETTTLKNGSASA